eukprot:CAMPEP_0197055470 /NCGR_PEP_ID=MMETSP1384-20130603/66300_1 /TAXON_ID=29189 /ORGANISM="Ammonia sp." /LENGTH=209 /DNA_ID=CAMNT_0042489063 /DNA_START=74 /DNA_END=699 /DNA_ORIENTATION=+
MGDVGSTVATPFVAVATTVTGNANKKVYYDCPRCGDEVWVYAAGAAFVGRPCLDCRESSGQSNVITSVARTVELLECNDGDYDEEGISSSNDNEKIIHIRVRSIWLSSSGTACAIGSVVSGAVTGSTVTHWWVEIETESGWYCAMWDKPNLVLSSEDSRSEVTRKGKSAVGAQDESKDITDKYDYSCSHRGKTIGDLRRWMEQYRKRGP